MITPRINGYTGPPVPTVPDSKKRLLSKVGGLGFICLGFVIDFFIAIAPSVEHAQPHLHWLSPLSKVAGTFWLAAQRIHEMYTTVFVNYDVPTVHSAPEVTQEPATPQKAI